MNSRQAELLQLIAESYIATAEPVGSKFLVAEHELAMSDATVRNEMRELEEGGYLTHPHTSAGRMPTAAGYRYYVEHLLCPTTPDKKLRSELSELQEDARREPEAWKLLAKLLAGEVGNAVFVVFDRGSIYYTGISFLFAQPEFHDLTNTVNVSAMFDECEDHIDAVFDRLESREPRALIGSDNPLSAICSLVGMRLPRGRWLTIVGPQRMDYAKSLGLLAFVRESLG